MARPSCLYCGAALPAEAVAAAASAAALEVGPAPTDEGPARMLLLVDSSSADPRTLGVALELSGYESALRHRRGGYSLEGVLSEAAAEPEAARLRAAGLGVFLVPESRARAEPWLAVAGTRQDGGDLSLRGAGGLRQVSGPDLLLVVRGPIVREYQAPLTPRKVQTARLADGYRFHLHLRSSPQVLELDPGDFDFGARAPVFGSSLLEMNDWLASLVEGVTVDDAFRYSTPALGPGSEPAGPLAATQALSRGPKARDQSRAAVHDNLRQFRFYSGWRGEVERAKGTPS
jgi:hypothetical protein